jgi:hypothetical protein
MFVCITTPHSGCDINNSINAINRICDTRSSNIADIAEKVFNNNGFNTKTLKNTILRSIVDMNRKKPLKTKKNNKKSVINNSNNSKSKISNQNEKNMVISDMTSGTENKLNNANNANNAGKLWSKYHAKIKRTLRYALKKNDIVILLDIHSYPYGSFGNSLITLIDTKYLDTNMTLNKHFRHITLELANIISQTMEIRIPVFQGLYNDIQDSIPNEIQTTHATHNNKKVIIPFLIEFCEDIEKLTDEMITKFFELFAKNIQNIIYQ